MEALHLSVKSLSQINDNRYFNMYTGFSSRYSTCSERAQMAFAGHTPTLVTWEVC